MVSQERAINAEGGRVGSFCLVTGLFTFVFLCSFFRVTDPDTGYHIRTGAYVLEHHQIPSTNTFSYTTPGEEWLLHQWWPGILYNRVYHIGGVAGLICVKAAIATMLMFVVWCTARRLLPPRSLWAFWLVTIGVMIARVRFFERPDLISALIFALVVYCDLRFDKVRHWQWIGLPLIMAFWANTHAGVAYGFVFLVTIAGSEWVEKLWKLRRESGALAADQLNSWKLLMVRPLGIVLALVSSVATLQLINPNGYRVMLVPITQSTSSFWQSVIGEYQSPIWAFAKLFYLSLAALVILQVLTWRCLRWRFFLPAIVFAYLACSSQRSMLAYSIVAVPYAAFLISRLPELRLLHRVKRLQPLLLPVAWAGIVLLVVLPNQWFQFGIGLYAPYYPIDMFRFIDKEVPPQNMFHSMRYGGGMLWWLYPRFKPFLDGRGDAYTPEFWQKEYFPVLKAEPGWREILKKYDAHAVWLPIGSNREVSRLGKLLYNDPQWALVAFNDGSLLFLERTEFNRAVISSNEFRMIWPGDWTFSKVNPDTIKSATAEACRALDRSPDSVFVRTAAARTSMLSGEYTKAAVLYAALIESLGQSEPYSRDYAYCLFMLGRLEEADRIFKRMIAKGWLPGFACYMRYRIAVERKNWAAADRYLVQALELEPANQNYREAQARLHDAVKPTVFP